MERKAEHYATSTGKKPFWKWFKGLDFASRYTVDRYIFRVCGGGSVKNIKYLDDGVSEIKIDRIRVYFAETDDTIVLLWGGDKGTVGAQRADIDRAKRYWRDYVQKK